MSKLVTVLHDATHQVPGVPGHRDHGAEGRRHQGRPNRHDARPHARGPRRRHETPPRVLVAWQTWIAHLVGHDAGR